MISIQRQAPIPDVNPAGQQTSKERHREILVPHAIEEARARDKDVGKVVEEGDGRPHSNDIANQEARIQAVSRDVVDGLLPEVCLSWAEEEVLEELVRMEAKCEEAVLLEVGWRLHPAHLKDSHVVSLWVLTPKEARQPD